MRVKGKRRGKKCLLWKRLNIQAKNNRGGEDNETLGKPDSRTGWVRGCKERQRVLLCGGGLSIEEQHGNRAKGTMVGLKLLQETLRRTGTIKKIYKKPTIIEQRSAE